MLHELPRDKERLRERTAFWDFDADTNVMPLKDVEGGWWFASWDLKVRASPSRPELAHIIVLLASHFASAGGLAVGLFCKHT